jgi:hypothetical protein
MRTECDKGNGVKNTIAEDDAEKIDGAISASSSSRQLDRKLEELRTAIAEPTLTLPRSSAPNAKLSQERSWKRQLSLQPPRPDIVRPAERGSIPRTAFGKGTGVQIPTAKEAANKTDGATTASGGSHQLEKKFEEFCVPSRSRRCSRQGIV